MPPPNGGRDFAGFEASKFYSNSSRSPCGSLRVLERSPISCLITRGLAHLSSVVN
ncbi:unnamed protein product, partial [Nesidiocoris tenuis]